MSLHPTKNYFKEFKGNHRIYIETGSHLGDSIELALQAGYERILSMDIDGANIAHCHERFDLENRFANISLTCGDSAVSLLKMMKYVNEPAMIWLDAHSQLLDDEPPSENPFPLLMELQQLSKHPIKTHTILIDDILILTHPQVTGWDKADIEKYIYLINPGYKIAYLSNPVVGNILLAQI